MTNIIKLNESINDYAARPVITALGEPDLAIRPSTYLAALGTSTNIDPKQILIDGSFGQTTNPAPFLGVGTGAMTVKSDANGAYLAMPQKGIRTGAVMSVRNDRGTLAIIKLRINDIFEGGVRILSVGTNLPGLSTFGLNATTVPVKNIFLNHNSLIKLDVDNQVHTIAIYTRSNQYNVFIDNKKYTGGYNNIPTRDDSLGIGINTRFFDDIPPNNIDLYNFEFYVDVVLTDKQIEDYLLTF